MMEPAAGGGSSSADSLAEGRVSVSSTASSGASSHTSTQSIVDLTGTDSPLPPWAQELPRRGQRSSAASGPQVIDIVDSSDEDVGVWGDFYSSDEDDDEIAEEDIVMILEDLSGKSGKRKVSDAPRLPHSTAADPLRQRDGKGPAQREEEADEDDEVPERIGGKSRTHPLLISASERREVGARGDMHVSPQQTSDPDARARPQFLKGCFPEKSLKVLDTFRWRFERETDKRQVAPRELLEAALADKRLMDAKTPRWKGKGPKLARAGTSLAALGGIQTARSSVLRRRSDDVELLTRRQGQRMRWRPKRRPSR
jgi:hypothetical protein